MINAKFNTKAAGNDKNVSNGCNSLFMLNELLVVKGHRCIKPDVVCISSGKGSYDKVTDKT